MSTSYIPANGTTPNTVQAHAIAGEPVFANIALANAAGGPNVANAAAFSTAPYRPSKPKRRACSVEGCKGSPMKTVDYCVGHARSMGLLAPRGE